MSEQEQIETVLANFDRPSYVRTTIGQEVGKRWQACFGNDPPLPERLPAGLRYLTPTILASLFDFPADMSEVAVEVNQLNNQVLVQYQEEDLSRLLN